MSPQWMTPHLDAQALLAGWLVAVYALYMQCLVVRRVRAHHDGAAGRDTGFAWMAGGALCVGTGIWAEGILTFVSLKLPGMAMGYALAVVMASWLPAVGISAGSIWMHFHGDLPVKRRVMGGLLIGPAMCLLSFIDISSLVIKPGIAFDAGFVAAASLMMLLACAVGSVLVRRALQGPLSHAYTLLAATMAASLFTLGQLLIVSGVNVRPGAVCLSADQLSPESLRFLLTVPVLIVLALVHLGTVLDDRGLRQRQALQDSLKQAQAALEEAAQHDAATGLLNRLGLDHALRQAVAEHAAEQASPASLALFHLSLDGFKTHVDTYGHEMGDTIVRHLAGRLRGLVRDGDVLARAETDEYLLLCHGLSDERVVAHLAQRLGDAIREPCLIRDRDIMLSCSIGIACHVHNGADAEHLLSQARDAMLTARKAGGGVYCFYERGMDRIGAEQVEMQCDLRHALARHELSLHFQPKLRVGDEAVCGVEALLRWTHPQRGTVSPAQFIPVAERFGLIGELGLWVLDEACRHVRAWHDAGLDMPVAINMSAQQLRQPDLELRVRDALKRHRVPARMLILEITESTAMDDIDASLRVFDMLDAIGVRLSIDDFGTGHSSLSYLRRLPARQLKIDRSFVNDLAASLDAQAIVEAVVRLSHALGLKVVAEGVETHEQAQILARLQCDELQGFLFARPMPEAALLAWLAQRGASVRPSNLAAPAHAALIDDEGADRPGWSELEVAG